MPKKIVQEIELVASFAKVKDTQLKEVEKNLKELTEASSNIAIKIDSKTAKDEIKKFTSFLKSDVLKGVDLSSVSNKFLSELFDENKTSKEFDAFLKNINERLEKLAFIGNKTKDFLPKLSGNDINRILDTNSLEEALELSKAILTNMEEVFSEKEVKSDIPKEIKKYIVSAEEAIEKIKKIKTEIQKIQDGKMQLPVMDTRTDEKEKNWETTFKYAARLKSLLGDEWLDSDIISKSGIKEDVIAIFSDWEYNVDELSDRTKKAIDKILKYKDEVKAKVPDTTEEKSKDDNNKNDDQDKNGESIKITDVEIDPKVIQNELDKHEFKIKVKADIENKSYHDQDILTDEDGNPIIAFRGVGDWAGSAFKGHKDNTFFSTDLEVAEKYAREMYADHGKVFAANLKMMNPWVFDNDGKHWNEIKLNETYDKKVLEQLKIILEKKKKKFEGANQLFETDDVADAVKASGQGFDGVIFKNIIDGAGKLANDYIVFTEDQLTNVRTITDKALKEAKDKKKFNDLQQKISNEMMRERSEFSISENKQIKQINKTPVKNVSEETISVDNSDAVEAINTQGKNITDGINDIGQIIQKLNDEKEINENNIKPQEKEKLQNNTDTSIDGGIIETINTIGSDIQSSVKNGSDAIVEAIKATSTVETSDSNKTKEKLGKPTKKKKDDDSIDIDKNLKNLTISGWLKQYLKLSSEAALASAKIESMNGNVNKIDVDVIEGREFTTTLPASNGADSLQVELQRQIQEEAERKLKILLANMPKFSNDDSQAKEIFDSIREKGNVNAELLQKMGVLSGNTKYEKESLAWAEKHLKIVKQIADLENKTYEYGLDSKKGEDAKIRLDKAKRDLALSEQNRDKYGVSAESLFKANFGISFNEYEKALKSIREQNAANKPYEMFEKDSIEFANKYLTVVDKIKDSLVELNSIDEESDPEKYFKATQKLEKFNNELNKLNKTSGLKSYLDTADKIWTESGNLGFYTRQDNIVSAYSNIINANNQDKAVKGKSDKNYILNERNKLADRINKLTGIDKNSITNVNEYENAIKQLTEALEYLDKVLNEANPSKQSNDYKEAIKQISKANEILNKDSLKSIDMDRFYKDRATILNYIKKNTKANNFVGSDGMTYKELETRLSLIAKNSTGYTEQDRKEIMNMFVKLKGDIKEAGKEGVNFFDMLKQRATSFAAYMATFVSFQDFIYKIREAISTVVELNTQLVELSKVSDQSLKSLESQFDDFADISKEIGGTISDTISATADWSRNGYSVDQAKELARVAQLYKNVGDGIDINTANASLISTLRGFEMEASDAEKIIDSFNEVKL